MRIFAQGSALQMLREFIPTCTSLRITHVGDSYGAMTYPCCNKWPVPTTGLFMYSSFALPDSPLATTSSLTTLTLSNVHRSDVIRHTVLPALRTLVLSHMRTAIRPYYNSWKCRSSIHSNLTNAFRYRSYSHLTGSNQNSASISPHPSI